LQTGYKNPISFANQISEKELREKNAWVLNERLKNKQRMRTMFHKFKQVYLETQLQFCVTDGIFASGEVYETLKKE